jgi:cytochrome c556
MNQPGEMSKDESPFDTEAFHIEIQQIVKAEKVGEQQRDEESSYISLNTTKSFIEFRHTQRKNIHSSIKANLKC